MNNKIEGKITGITFFNISGETWDKLKTGTLLTLNRDFNNQYDINAIQVLYAREQIGWIEKKDNVKLAALLGQNTLVTTKITRIFGNPVDRPHLEVQYTWDED